MQWLYYFHVGTKPKNVAKQFPLVSIGKSECVATIRVEGCHLFRVPNFMLNPTGSGLTELQFSPVLGGACKDAIPGIKVLSHCLQIDVFGRLGLNFGRFNCIYGKASNAPAQVAPCIYVPVVTVVNKLLWRDSPLQRLARQSVVMSNLNFFAFKGGLGDDLKSCKRESALPRTDRANPLSELLWVQALIAENVIKPFAQWPQFRPKR